MMRRLGLFIAAVFTPTMATAQDYRERLPEDEIVYFLLPDRFENGETANDRGKLKGDRFKTGYDPAIGNFYHGGDLKGLATRLDYIQNLGATAIWVGPVFKNKPVQGGPGQESAGYHGYWITDFTTIDPHLGTEADFKSLVDGAHTRGLKVYMDIIVNHTADVIAYKECPASSCPYRSRADYPGAAYTPYIPRGQEHTKVPDWLNDVTLYHNRGNTTYRGESMGMGDFAGLDDLKTEDPRVVKGFIDVFGSWIDRFKVDGFRIDTAKYVNPEFWTAFAPAMIERAKTGGIPNFHIFGEVASGDFEPELSQVWTQISGLPTNLDFAFRKAVELVVAGNGSPAIFDRLFAADALYKGGEATALRTPTFISSHDLARFAYFARKSFPEESMADTLKRVEIANALLFVARGVPVVYSGDEQGFIGHGEDQAARQDMFASMVASYNDQPLLGTSSTTAQANFNPTHPLYRQIAMLSGLRRQYPALRHGRQILRNYDDAPGLLAISRMDTDNREVLAVFNTATHAISANVETDPKTASLIALAGECPAAPRAPGSFAVSLPPLSYIICVAQ
jgi:glycosidase